MLTVAAHPLRLRIVAELAGADGYTGHGARSGRRGHRGPSRCGLGHLRRVGGHSRWLRRLGACTAAMDRRCQRRPGRADDGFVRLQRRLLRAAGARLPLSWWLSTAHLANAIAFAVPFAGSGMATGFAYRRFRRAGADPAAATLVLTLAGIFSGLEQQRNGQWR